MKNQLKKIVIGISGGIAAYKSVELVRLLRQQDYQVRVVLTQHASEFVTPLTLQAISNHPVYSHTLNTHAINAMDHIDLAKWADLILIAPASANMIARLAHGFADDLLTTICCATTAPIIIAPAMNQQMWNNSATQANIQQLRERHIQIYGPASGDQACGDIGLGRMLEPFELLQLIQVYFIKPVFNNYRVMITAGPTQEKIDPARYISNYSSGKMGYAIAQAAKNAGADVTLITGPTALQIPQLNQVIQVTTALEMHKAVMENIDDIDIFIGAAAVSDYRPSKIFSKKLKRQSAVIDLHLTENPDIITEVARRAKRPKMVIGFAAETNDLSHNALEKLRRKNLDLIIGNLVGEKKGFMTDTNILNIYPKNGEQTKWPEMSKQQCAVKLIEYIGQLLSLTS